MIARLLVLGAYDKKHADLANQLRRIYCACPFLFESITARSDQRGLDEQFAAVGLDEDDFEHEEFVAPAANEAEASDVQQHFDASVRVAITSKAIRQSRRRVNDGHPLPVSPSNDFRNSLISYLREAYCRHITDPQHVRTISWTDDQMV